MKKLLVCLLFSFFMIFANHKSNAQCSINVSSTSNYNVNININITSILVTPNGCGTGFCLCGYVYKYVVSYTITTSGTGTPNIFTLQGVIYDSNGNSFYDLPNGAGTGTVNSANVSTSQTNCATVTSSTFNPCITIQIQGSGIPYQNITATCPCPVATPIELIDFKGSSTSNGVLLNWTTATEINNDYFILERSTDLNVWENIAKIKGGGTISTIQNYSYLDTNPSVTNYYRLKQVDYNSHYEYSNIIYIHNVSAIKTFVFPNPTNTASIDVKIVSNSLSDINLVLYDVLGRVIDNRIIDKEKIETKYTLSLPSKQVYILYIIQDNVLIGIHKIVSN